MDYERDRNKAASNLKKLGVSATVFGGSLVFMVQ